LDATTLKPRVIARADHSISRSRISPNALKVLYRLIEGGFDAYLVGGGVRDLLLGREPKDFDVATNARPEQIRELFRNARLIGRRFRLAHIRFGNEIVEVATFRSASAPVEEPEDEGEGEPVRAESARAQSPNGMLLTDNVYGTIEEDALRRDFTVNALYYTPRDFCIYDFVGGMEDLAAGVIRIIGEPEARYREDPVRMLRVLRFAAKLGLAVEERTSAPVASLAHLIEYVPAARLFDELNKLFLAGFGERAWTLLRDSPLVDHLLPETAAVLDAAGDQFLTLAMRDTDQRLAADRSVSSGFMYAALLWPAVRERLLESNGEPSQQEFDRAADGVLASQQTHTLIPRRFVAFIKEVWELQPKLERRPRKLIPRLLEHPRFRAAFDFLALRAAQDVPVELAEWWQRAQVADAAQMHELLDALRNEDLQPTTHVDVRAPGTQSRRRRRRRRRPNVA
jgi:poly(A) polymerase